MRILLFYSLLFIFPVSISAQTQKIDSTNYYDYISTNKRPKLKGSTFTMNWLRPNDAIPIIKDEMLKAGYGPVKINFNYKLPADAILRINVYSEKASMGFYYIDTHRATPFKSDRKNPGMYLIDVAKLDVLPKNIFPLNENVYWYEYTDNKADDRYLVTRKIIENILRQDIRTYLKKYKH